MSILWENATEVAPFVLTLAKAYQLTVLDEDGQLTQPNALSAGKVPATLRLSLTLHITGKQPALDAKVTEGHQTLAHQVVATRLQAHLMARSLAEAHDEIGYQLDDPRCIA